MDELMEWWSSRLEHVVGDFYDTDGGEWEAYLDRDESSLLDSSIGITYEGEIIYSKPITDFIQNEDELCDLEDIVGAYIQEEHIEAEEYEVEIDDDVGNMFIGDNLFDI